MMKNRKRFRKKYLNVFQPRGGNPTDHGHPHQTQTLPKKPRLQNFINILKKRMKIG